MKIKRLLLFLSSFLLILSISCKKDQLITNSGAKLDVKADTILFDTVFTTVGSLTERFTVRNPHKQAIKISNIYLKNGNSSNFRFNVDGFPGPVVRDIEIRAEDSIFVFVEVTVDPNGSNNPLVIEDQLVFETNGNLQDVDLVAWGQDAYFYPTVVFGDALQYVLPNDKPNVFYGYAIVDSASCLTIPAGTQVHFHANSGILVLKEACLKVEGTVDNKVVIQGDRLEDFFKEEPGQWDQIWLSANSVNNEIRHAIIKNGIIGIRVDTIGETTPTLIMENTVVQNMSGTGLLAQGSDVVVNNCVFANCGQFTAALRFGGNYQFNHCTFANYWRFGSRNNGQLLLNNYFETEEGIFARPLNVTFDNCIVFGTLEDELELDDDSGDDFEYTFNHCILRTTLNTSDQSRYISLIKNPGGVAVDGSPHDPVFNDPTELDFMLFELSKAIDAGTTNTAGGVLMSDLEERMRDAQPDIGAYEFIP